MATVQGSLAITDVAAFIDWNAQLLLTRSDLHSDPIEAAESAIKLTSRRIARCLTKLDDKLRFKVVLRLYHGWHKGYEPTANRKAAQTAVARTDYATLSQKANVVFSPQVVFGDHLLYASDLRLVPRLGCHLPNTLRSRYGHILEEKMVDTALAADVVSSANRDKNNWILVVTEDDDMVPPVYAAESALAGTSSKVIILQKNVRGTLLVLNNILFSG